MEGKARHPEMAEDLRAELLEKVLSLKERLQRTQVPTRVTQTLDRLIAALGEKLEDVKPGILLPRSRTVETDLNAYDTKEGRKELSEDVVSGMKDVLASLDDLKGQFREIIENDAAVLSQKLLGAKADAVLAESDSIIQIAQNHPELVSDNAIEGMESIKPDIAEIEESLASTDDDKNRSAILETKSWMAALQSLNMRNFVSSVIREAKRTGTAYSKDLNKHQGEAVTAATIAGLLAALGNPVAAIAALGLIAWKLLPKEAEDIRKELEEQEDKADNTDEDTSNDN